MQLHIAYQGNALPDALLMGRQPANRHAFALRVISGVNSSSVRSSGLPPVKRRFPRFFSCNLEALDSWFTKLPVDRAAIAAWQADRQAIKIGMVRGILRDIDLSAKDFVWLCSTGRNRSEIPATHLPND